MNEILDGLLSKLESLENEASKIKLEASKSYLILLNQEI